MDGFVVGGSADARGTDMLTQSFNFVGLPVYIISSFFPEVLKLTRRHPKAIRALTIPLAAYFAFSYGWGKLLLLWQYLMKHFMSSVTISSTDIGLSAAFRQFLESKDLLLVERDMTAHSGTFLRNRANDFGMAYNSNVVKFGAVNYEPTNDLQAFRHNKRFFFITSRASVNQYLDGAGCSDFKVWTFGWSPEPIRSLIDTAYRTEELQRRQVKTCIYTPELSRMSWKLRRAQSRRPLSSVYLDRREKKMIVQDVKDYLDPATARWYAERGIPYRRGYLFHGDPGTGKTSLAMALAGHFKLDVYIVSLLHRDMNDATLQTLFQSLRPGVIVLLEDIDAAGVGRKRTADQEECVGALSLDIETPMFASDQDKGENRKGKVSEHGQKRHLVTSERVTLSGLLNAIDGAGAPEGHLLVMTSNKPEALDEALVRPGRVDVRVKFDFASREQARDIFVNMYRPALDVGEAGEKTAEYRRKLAHVRKLGQRFRERVPARKLSPAQLQDYILMRKTRPESAVEEVQAWMREKLGLSEEVLANGVETDDGHDSWHRGVNGIVKAEGGAEEDGQGSSGRSAEEEEEWNNAAAIDDYDDYDDYDDEDRQQLWDRIRHR